MVDWQQLAVTKAEELGAADPTGAALLILRAINPQRLIDEACMTRQHGVPPPEGFTRCVDFERHNDQYDNQQDALDAWREGNIMEEHWLNHEYPCQEVLDEAQQKFLEVIEASWGIYEPGQLLDHLDYIQEHIKYVPPKFQEKWKMEFVALFGREKTFAEFTPEEASWLRLRVAAFVATSPKIHKQRSDKPRRPKRRKKGQRVSKHREASR